MLFEVYWSGIGGNGYPRGNKLAEIIKEAPPEDSFIFITVQYQEAALLDWAKKHELKIQYQGANKLTNRVHIGHGRNMRIWVLGNGAALTPSEYKAPVRKPRQLKLL